ncbi:MAG: hypothetical protein J6P31_05735 [Oscillospiraceae bacterium]|nr:hypothetical protein [Oscillospiraceae bacterium]
MEAFFQTILRMSLRASVVILAVLLVRLALRRAPKRWSYALWTAVGFRLACPVSILAGFSLFRLLPGLAGPDRTGAGAGDSLLEPMIPSNTPQISWDITPQASIPSAAPVALTPEETIDPAALLWKIGAILWLIGVAVMLIAALWQYLRLRRRLVGAVRVEENLYETDGISSPFILGLLPPKIYLPLGMEGSVRSYVLSHERFHIRHLDPVMRLAAYGLLSIHWFNPLVWLSFRLMGRDMEMRCDEAVMQKWGGGTDYSRTLLQVATRGRFLGPAPLAFGETDVKIRIRNALNWRRPRTWVTLTALVLCIVVIAVSVTNPGGKKNLEELLGVSIEEVTRIEAAAVVLGEKDGYPHNETYRLTAAGNEVRELLDILKDTAFRQKNRLVTRMENVQAIASLRLLHGDKSLGFFSFRDAIMTLDSSSSYRTDPAVTAELRNYIIAHGERSVTEELREDLAEQGEKQETISPEELSRMVLRNGTYYLERPDEDPASRFWIRINKEKGSYQYYETPISSYVGMGFYQLEGDILIISDGMPGMEGADQRVNRFRVGNGSLTWIADGSDGFFFTELQDGDTFILGPDNGEFVPEGEPAGSQESPGKRFMTLEDVYALAKQGEDLRYSDLEPYIGNNEEQSGGTAVIIFPVEFDSGRDFQLMFRGNIYEQPTNVLLTAAGFGMADIRYVDPEQFVKKVIQAKDLVMPLLQESNSYSLLLASEFMNNAALSRSQEADGAYLIRGQVLAGFEEIKLGQTAREAGLQLYQIAYRLCPDNPERVQESEDLRIEDGWITEQTARGAPCILYCSGQEGIELVPFVNLTRGDLVLWTDELEGKDLEKLCLDTWLAWREQAQGNLPDLSDIASWGQLDPRDPRIHVSAPYSVDLQKLLPLLREGENVQAPMLNPIESYVEIYYSEGQAASNADPHLLLTIGGLEDHVAVWINTPAGSSPRFQRNPALYTFLRSCTSEQVNREPDFSRYQPIVLYDCRDISFYHIDPDSLTLAEKVECQEDGTYHLPSDTAVLVDFYDERGLKPARAYFMQEGSSQARELCYANPPWPQMPLSLRLLFYEEDTAGMLWFVFDYGDGTSVKTEPFSIVIERTESDS